MIFVLICMAGIFWFLVKRDERKRIRAGYWVEHLSPGQLREDEKSFAVVYHEGEQSQFFHGRIDGAALHRLPFPSDADWQAQMPEWLHGKRLPVHERIKRRMSNLLIES